MGTMPSLRSGGRTRARSRGFAPAALVAAAGIAALALLALGARNGNASPHPCKGFDCANASDTSGSPGKDGSSLVQNASSPVIAYSESNHGDLRVASRTAASRWVVEVVDTAGDVGAAPSMTLDDGGNLVISYFDATRGDLKLARNLGGSWIVERVDTGGVVGRFSSIASFPGGVGIAYYDATLGALKYAERHAGALEWQIQTLDGGRTGLYPSLIARGDERAISYYDQANGDLRLAIRFPGGWSTMTVDAGGDVGGWSSLCRTDVGYGIAYYDFTNGNLEYAWSFGPGPPWTIERVDGDGDVGRYCSAFALTPTPDDQITIGYYDATRGDLKYAQKRGTWSVIAVDTSGNVGGSTSLAGGPAPDDTLGIAYYDYTNADLRYASHVNPLTAVPPADPAGRRARVSWERDAAGTGGLIRYGVPAAGSVRLGLYDAEGRTVATLLHESHGLGDGELRWDGRDSRGRLVHSGVYFIRLDTPLGSAATPAVLVR